MSQLEKDLVNKAREWCKKNEVLFIKFTPFGSKGWPDTILVFPGGFHLWVEFKNKNKKPRKLQTYRMAELAKQGALSVWFDDWAVCKDYLQDCLEAASEVET